MPKVKCICKNCGKEFEMYPSILKRGQGKFCSRHCARIGKNNPSYKGKIKIKCISCGKEREIFPSKLKNRKWRYCCRCKGKGLIGSSNPHYKGKVKRYCVECRKELELIPARAKKKNVFCSVQCKNKWSSRTSKGANSPHWKGGLSYEPYCPKFNSEFRDRVRAFFEYQCALCGKPQKENLSKKGDIRKLCVHHVHYRKDACCDEEVPRYFITLCLACHIKTNFNREYWMKKFEEMITKQYNGRCYLRKEEISF